MAGRHPWSALRTPPPADRSAWAAWVAAGRDLAFAARERRAALLLTSAADPGAYHAARRVVHEAFGINPDAVPHDWPAS